MSPVKPVQALQAYKFRHSPLKLSILHSTISFSAAMQSASRQAQARLLLAWSTLLCLTVASHLTADRAFPDTVSQPANLVIMACCRVPVDSPERFRMEVLFSPGAAYSPYAVVPLHQDHTLPVTQRVCLHQGGSTDAALHARQAPHQEPACDSARLLAAELCMLHGPTALEGSGGGHAGRTLR